MMLGVCSGAFTGRAAMDRAHRQEKAIYGAHSAGFGAIELITLPNMDCYPVAVQNASRKAVRETGIRATMHATFMDINLGAVSEGIRKESVSEIRRTIDYARRIGAPVVTIHPGRVGIGSARKEYFENFVGAAASLSEYANDSGVCLCVENMESQHYQVLQKPAEFKRMFRDSGKSLMMTLDLAHVGMALDAKLIKSEKEWKPLFKRVKNVHISGFRPGMEHTDTSLKESKYRYDFFYKHLLKRLDGSAVLEMMDLKKALESAEIVRTAVV